MKLRPTFTPPRIRKPKSILTLCRDVLRVDEKEVAELEEMANGQCAYLSPLKMATSARQHALGRHNLAVIAAYRELRQILEDGKEIANGK